MYHTAVLSTISYNSLSSRYFLQDSARKPFIFYNVCSKETATFFNATT